MARPSVIEKLNNARVLSAAIKELRADVETIRDDAEARQWLDALAAARQVCGDDIDLSATEFVEVVDAFNCHYYSRKGDMMPLERVLAKSRAFKTMEVHFMGNGTPRVCSKSWADKLGNFAFSEWNTDPSKTSNTDKDEILAFEKFPVFEEISALDQNCGPPVIKELNLRIWRAELNKSEEKQQKRPTPFSMKAKREIRTLREDFPEIRSDREASKWLTALGAMRQCYGALWTLSRKTFVQIIQCFQKTIDASACATPMPLEYLLAISNVCVQSLGRTEFTQEASNLMNIAAHTWKTGLDGAEIQEGMDKACLFFLHNQLLRRGAYMYGDNGPPLVGKNKFQRWKSGDRKKELESLKWRWNTESSEDRIETEEEKCLELKEPFSHASQQPSNTTTKSCSAEPHKPSTPERFLLKRDASVMQTPTTTPEKRLNLDEAFLATLATKSTGHQVDLKILQPSTPGLVLLTEYQKENWNAAQKDKNQQAQAENDRFARIQLRAEKRLRTEAEAH